MTTKHTPGPWKLYYDEDAFEACHKITMPNVGCIGRDVARYIEWEHGLTPDDGEQFKEAEANARLIAAAPELMHELRSLIDKCLELGYYKGMEKELASAEGAIKKATNALIHESRNP